MKYFLATCLLSACLCSAQAMPSLRHNILGNFAPLQSQAGPTAVSSYVDVHAYGAIGDGQRKAGCSVSAGSPTLTCPNGTFVPADTGKVVTVAFAGAATGCKAYATQHNTAGACWLKTKIQHYTDSAHVTMAASATTSAPSTAIQFGTDNRAAIQAAVDMGTNTQVAEFDVYIPHAVGQGVTGPPYSNFPGCYVVDGTIYLPDPAFSQFRFVRIRGDGNQASLICGADPSQDVFSVQTAFTAATEYWFKDFGIAYAGNYLGTSLIHCHRCVQIRIEGMWLSEAQKAFWADVAKNEDGTQLVRFHGNVCEYTFSCIYWTRDKTAGRTVNQFLDAYDNVLDITAPGWALDSSGGRLNSYGFDLNKVDAANIHDNIFWGGGRGILCVDCADLEVHSNDFTYMPSTLLRDSPGGYGYHNLSLRGTGIHHAVRNNVHDNHFASANSEAVEVAGDVGAAFHGNHYTYTGAAQPYMAITAAKGANQLAVTNEIINTCASPCITVAAGALEPPSVISDNSFPSSVTTPIAIAGTLASGVYVAQHSGDAAGNNANFAGYQVNGTSGFTGTKKVGSCVLTISGGIITNVTGC